MVEHIPLVLAQAIEPASGLYELLLKNGVLGGAVAVLVWFLIKRDGDLQKSQEGRLNDSKQLAEIIKNHTVAIQASNVAQDERNRALEIAARAAEKSALVIENLNKEISELKSQIRK